MATSANPFMESATVGGMPFVIHISRSCLPKNKKKRETLFRILMIILTYITYSLFNMARRPIAVVKAKLVEECNQTESSLLNATDGFCGETFFDLDTEEFMGFLDCVHIASYGVSLYMSGIIADCYNPRYYLTFGCLLSGFFCALLGLSDYWKIRSYEYFTMILILFGVSQSTGWPVVLSCVTHWYNGGRRGMFFGFWNTHNYVGSMLGIYIAGSWVDMQWGVSFFIPGFIIAVTGVIVYLAMVADPVDLKELDETKSDVFTTRMAKAEAPNWLSSTQSITMYDAIQLPGVIEFSTCMFFSRMVGYIFLYWLPTFIKESQNISATTAAYYSIAYFLGGSLGGIVAGVLVDLFRRSALVCAFFLLLSIPVLMLIQVTDMRGNLNIEFPVFMLVGLFVEAPYIVTSTSVSADLGTHKMIKRNHRAISTIGGIVEGTGAIGAAIGTYVCGVIVLRMDVSYLIYMMMGIQLVAMLCLSRQAYKDFYEEHKSTSFRKYWATPFV